MTRGMLTSRIVRRISSSPRAVSALAGLLTAGLLALPLLAGSTGSTALYTPQGEDSSTAFGDYTSDTAGLDTFYSYFVEVPNGTSRLVVDLFDADIGAGGTGTGGEAPAGRDRARPLGGPFTSSVTYSLLDPSGTAQATQFSSGDSSSPSGADNAWLTLYDSSSASVAFEGLETATEGDGDNELTIDVPTGTVAGNLLIAVVSKDDDEAISAPGGWTTINEGASSDDMRLGVFYRVAGGSEPADYTFTWSSNEEAVGAILRYSGVDTSDPIDVSGAATGFSDTPTAPSVTTTVANARVLRIYGADDDDLSGSPYPAGTTGRFNIESGGGGQSASGGGADADQASAGATGTAAFALDDGDNEQWRAVTVAIAPAAGGAPDPGHWELRVLMGGGDDINALGIRAHDGTSGAGGTELNVYYHSFASYGIQDDNSGATGAGRTYTNHPYITAGCDGEVNDFDWDYDSYGAPSTPISLTSRSGSFTQNNAALSPDDTWLSSNFSGWTTDFSSTDYGIWSMSVDIDLDTDGGNYGVVYVGAHDAASPAPTAQPEDDTFRVYLPTDAGGAPVKTYVEQLVTHVNGPNPPTVGNTSEFTVTIRVVNPTAQSIAFSTPSNVVTATVPTTAVTYNGNAIVSQGTIVSQPTVGGTGDVVWNPGTIAAGDTEAIAYNVNVTPTSAGQRILVTGSPGSNGTTAQYVDGTCSGGSCSGAQLTGATYLFGELCELAVTENVLTHAPVSALEAYEDGGGAVLAWETASEAGTLGFHLWRAAAGSRPERITAELLPGLLDAPGGGTYRFRDPDAAPGATYRYWVEEHEMRGRRAFHGPFEVTVGAEPPAGARPLAAGFESVARAPQRSLRSLAGAAAVPAAVPGAAVAGKPRVKLGVRNTGLHFVSAADLAAGLGVSENKVVKWLGKGRFLLETHGREVAWIPRLDAGSEGLAFYGEALADSDPDGLFSLDNVYFLTAKTKGPQMASGLAGSPLPASGTETFASTEAFEEDAIALTGLGLDPASDYWFWAFLRAGDPAADLRAFALEAPAAGPGATTLRLGLQGASAHSPGEQHHAEVWLNGTALGSVLWPGFEARQVTLAVPAGVLQPGANTLEVVAHLDSGVPASLFFVDRAELTYPRLYRLGGGQLAFRGDGHPTVTLTELGAGTPAVFDVTTPERPVWLGVEVLGGPKPSVSLAPSRAAEYLAVAEGAHLAPSFLRPAAVPDLLASRQGADYVIFTPAGLLAAAEKIADYRRSTGHRVLVVELEELYDALHDGLPSPEAIRDFLALGYATWSDPPRYALLLGTGSYDYRDLLGLGGSPMPPLLLATESGLFAADNLFGDVVGDDGVPEVAVGRVPAATAAEALAYLAKLRAYEASGTAWADGAVLLSDRRDAGADFGALSGRLERLLPPHYGALAIDLTHDPLGAARDDLFTAFEAGAALVDFQGHGGIDRFSAMGLLTSADVPALPAPAAGQLPLVTAMTCSVNRFEVPGFAPLGAALVNRSGAGALAVWGPSGLSLHASAADLAAAFYRALLGGGASGEVLVGDAVVEALGRFEPLHDGREMRLLYNLFGDPAARFAAAPGPPPAGGGSSGE